jgi:hypothetical protein
MTVRHEREGDDGGDDQISETESDRFIVKVAEYLQGAIGAHGWSEETVRRAFDEAVKHMPKGRARKALRAGFDEYANKLCDTIYRKNGPSIERTKEERKVAKLCKDPTSAWWALRQEPLADIASASLDELRVEFDYSLKRTSFDIPAHVLMKAMEISDMLPEDIAAMEEIREAALRRIVDIAQATKDAFEKMPTKTQDEFVKVNNLIGRLAGATAIRRKMQGARDETAKLAAEIVMLRHDFRKIASREASLSPPEHEIGVTASHDGAVLLGNYRGDLAALLAERLPEDENELTAIFGDGDLPIFECALGLGGFDADFEKALKKNGAMFGMLDIDVKDVKDVGKIAPPALLRRPPKAKFDANKEVNDYDMEAFAQAAAEVSMSSVAESSFNNADFIDTDYLTEALSLVGKDEDECSGPGRVKLYFAVVRIARAYIKLLNQAGKRKRSSAVARYMAVAPAPEVLLMHVPESCGIDNTDARAMTVELSVASIRALQIIVNEWNEMRVLFKSAAQSEGGFFIDVNRTAGDAAKLAFEQGKSAEDNDADDDVGVDDETEKELMAMLDKLEGPDASSDDSDDEASDGGGED